MSYALKCVPKKFYLVEAIATLLFVYLIVRTVKFDKNVLRNKMDPEFK